MALPQFMTLLSLLAPTSAQPIHKLDYLLSPETSRSQIGVWVGIALSIIVFAVLVFYLGVRRGRTGSWKCWRTRPNPHSTSSIPDSSSISTRGGETCVPRRMHATRSKTGATRRDRDVSEDSRSDGADFAEKYEGSGNGKGKENGNGNGKGKLEPTLQELRASTATTDCQLSRPPVAELSQHGATPPRTPRRELYGEGHLVHEIGGRWSENSRKERERRRASRERGGRLRGNVDVGERVEDKQLVGRGDGVRGREREGGEEMARDLDLARQYEQARRQEDAIEREQYRDHERDREQEHVGDYAHSSDYSQDRPSEPDDIESVLQPPRYPDATLERTAPSSSNPEAVRMGTPSDSGTGNRGRVGMGKQEDNTESPSPSKEDVMDFEGLEWLRRVYKETRGGATAWRNSFRGPSDYV